MMAETGQVWEDLDSRTKTWQTTGERRRVQVIDTESRRDGHGYTVYVRVQDLGTGRRTWIREDRLIHQSGHGQGRGYRLVKGRLARKRQRPRREPEPEDEG